MQIANCSWKSHIRDDATKSKVAHLQQIAAHCVGHVVVFSLFLWRCEMTHSDQVSRNLPRHSVTALCVPRPKGRCNCNCDLLLSSLARFVNWSCQLRCHWAKSAAASSFSSTARYQTIFIHKSQSHSVVNSLGTTAGLDLWGLSKRYKIFVNFLRKYLCTVLIFCAIISFAKYSRKEFQIFPRFMQRGEDSSIYWYSLRL